MQRQVITRHEFSGYVAVSERRLRLFCRSHLQLFSINSVLIRCCIGAATYLQIVVWRSLAAHAVRYPFLPCAQSLKPKRVLFAASSVFRAADMKEWAGLCTAFNKRMCEAPPQPQPHSQPRSLMTGDSFWKFFEAAMEVNPTSHSECAKVLSAFSGTPAIRCSCCLRLQSS